VQLAYTYSIAATLNVYPQVVSLNIDSSSRRRSGSGLTVEANAKIPAEQNSSFTSLLGNTSNLVATLNQNLQSYGMPTISGITVSTATSTVSALDIIRIKLSKGAVEAQLLLSIGLNTTFMSAIPSPAGTSIIILKIRVPLSVTDAESTDQQSRLIHGIATVAGVQDLQVTINSTLPSFPSFRRATLISSDITILINTDLISLSSTSQNPLLGRSTSSTAISVTGSGGISGGTSSTNISQSQSNSNTQGSAASQSVGSNSDDNGKIIGAAVGGVLGFLGLVYGCFLAHKKFQSIKEIPIPPGASQQAASVFTTPPPPEDPARVQVLDFDHPQKTTFV